MNNDELKEENRKTGERERMTNKGNKGKIR